jgi:hypothetical protein
MNWHGKKSEARHQSEMEAGNGKQVSNSSFIEQFSEVTTQGIAFSQQERSIKTRKLLGEPTVDEVPNSSAGGMEEIIPVVLGFAQWHQIHITAHITPEPDSLIGKMLSVTESSWIVEVPYRSEPNSAGQPLSHWPLLLTISTVKEQIARNSVPAITVFEGCQVEDHPAAGWTLFEGMGNCAHEDYIFSLQKLLNGVGGTVGIRYSGGG